MYRCTLKLQVVERHENKSIISKILPRQDLLYLQNEKAFLNSVSIPIEILNRKTFCISHHNLFFRYYKFFQ